MQAFFPKNRGHWKQFSSKELDEVGPRPERLPFDERFPQDVYVKKGYTPSEQMGIAMLALQEAGKLVLIEWTRQARLCSYPSAIRNTHHSGIRADPTTVYQPTARDHC